MDKKNDFIQIARSAHIGKRCSCTIGLFRWKPDSYIPTDLHQ